MTHIERIQSVFFDSDGPFGLSEGIFTNFATEIVGFTLSVIVSIFFAIWLDRRFDAYRRRKQMRFLAIQMVEAHCAFSHDIPNMVSDFMSKNNISGSYAIFYTRTKKTYEEISNLIDALLANYGLDLEPDCLSALGEVKYLARRLFDIADLETSISLRQAIADGALEIEAARVSEAYENRCENLAKNIRVFRSKLSGGGIEIKEESHTMSEELFIKLINYAAQEFYK